MRCLQLSHVPLNQSPTHCLHANVQRTCRPHRCSRLQVRASKAKLSKELEELKQQTRTADVPLKQAVAVPNVQVASVPPTQPQPQSSQTPEEDIPTGLWANPAVQITVAAVGTMTVISIFYGLVWIGGQRLMLEFKGVFGFTKKEFVSYSERRRLEQDIMRRKIEESGGPEQLANAPPVAGQADDSEDDLQLLPGK